MTLTNSRRPYTSSHPKRPKSDKPCPRFSTTGTCTRGLTCPYTHDPTTTTICWPFLSRTCPLPAAQCALSHDPTPERTPLCTHFLGGLCTQPACPLPHVNVGPRSGVCRAFAVLGYCPLGLECDKVHVRECPDFAETGSCLQSEAALGKGGKGGCKLPHVIRAAGARKLGPGGGAGARGVAAMKGKGAVAGDEDAGKASEREKEKEEDAAKSATAAAEMGDEFISLTFNESSEDEGSDSEEEDESESGEEGAKEEGEGEDGEGEDDDDEPASKSEDGDDEQMDGGGGGAAA
ncbi:hypothetical protein DFH08DRAFT_927124 [Mycena albidolilacea]|uniref:C3H1-type domain-containing protein n=1 Tax=Mycena albidolilacea TaxID=1033008 RepID=A0AAD6Z914_9AGAR|nr:hypothetical protein DFH08DRAFT_927124 [Mycena albidolilacea]